MLNPMLVLYGGGSTGFLHSLLNNADLFCVTTQFIMSNDVEPESLLNCACNVISFLLRIQSN